MHEMGTGIPRASRDAESSSAQDLSLHYILRCVPSVWVDTHRTLTLPLEDGVGYYNPAAIEHSIDSSDSIPYYEFSNRAAP